MVVPKLSDEYIKGTAAVSGKDVGQISLSEKAKLEIRKSAKPVALLKENEFKKTLIRCIAFAHVMLI
ncbi:hypothetical protein GCM10007987_16450 [Aliivibrio fischeri]|nr:hypothetical protein GCM10007987_16450 [Aliivibrio fischeri]